MVNHRVDASHGESPERESLNQGNLPVPIATERRWGRASEVALREGHRVSRNHVRSLTIELVGRAEKVACVLRSGTLPPGQSHEPRAPTEGAGRSPGPVRSAVWVPEPRARSAAPQAGLSAPERPRCSEAPPGPSPEVEGVFAAARPGRVPPPRRARGESVRRTAQHWARGRPPI